MKTMCKRTLAFLLCTLLLCSAASLAASAADVLSGSCGKDGDNVTWTLDTETGVLTISGTGEMADYTAFDNAPWFQYRVVPQSVTVEDGLTHIGDYSFFCLENVTSVTMANNVTSIGEAAFCACSSLTGIKISNSIKSIGDGAFEKCSSIKSMTIPYGVTYIGMGAFAHCISLESLVLPNSVTKMGSTPFFHCPNLVFVHIPASVTDIEEAYVPNECNPYICSDTAECYAKTYAKSHGFEFRVCGGHGEPAETPTLSLHDTKKTLPYGEKRTLTADVENLPDGAKIVWTADSDRVKLTPSADGRTSEVSAQKNGKVTVTAMVVDKDGKPIEQDGAAVSARVDLTAKANIFHKLWYWIFRIPWPFG